MKSQHLLQMLQEMQFENIGVFLASGNAVFQVNKRITKEKLSAAIEKQIEQTFGFVAECFLFTREELTDLAFADPFQLTEDQRSKFIVNVTFFIHPISKPDFQRIKKLAGDYDDFALKSGSLFWLCRGLKMSDSPIGDNLVKLLPKPNTTRKTDTLQRILRKYPI